MFAASDGYATCVTNQGSFGNVVRIVHGLQPAEQSEFIFIFKKNNATTVVGSTAKIGNYTPGRSPAATCGTGTRAGWYDCNFTDINGASRAGRIQTFKGAGTNNGAHAIFKRSGVTSAAFMSRGLLAPYTDIWNGTNDGTKYVGYPSGDSYFIGGTTVKNGLPERIRHL